MIRVLFVCLGNICRSPLAEGVFRKLVIERGLEDRIEVDSAGTGAWHVGEPPDRRMRATAEARGVSLNGIKARRVDRTDLSEYDYVFAMDRENLRDLRSLLGRDVRDVRANSYSPLRSSVQLFRTFDPAGSDPDVPDPYYGGSDGFTTVFDIVDRTSKAILDHIVKEEGLTAMDDSGGRGST